MAIQGNLQTMALTDLLGWASKSEATGVLSLEHKRVTRKIAFRAGRIVSCASDDPPSLLGQFLLARGKIDQQVLRKALAVQEQSGQSLGTILQEMGVLTEDEISREVAAKAEENIYGLFDWDDAVFRFEPGVNAAPYAITVDFSVAEVLEEGWKRQQHLEDIRGKFPSSAVVLRRTDAPVPDTVENSPLARRVLDCINGERSLAEILLHAHASEYIVCKFLYMLVRQNILEIIESREFAEAATTLVDTPAPAPAPTETSASSSPQEVPVFELATPDEAAAMDLLAPVAEEMPEEYVAEGEQQDEEHSEEVRRAAERFPELSEQIELAVHFIEQGESEAALQVLEHCYQAHPGDSYLRHLMTRAELSFLESVRGKELCPDKIPARLDGDEPTGLQPSELFLLGMIDGTSDIKTLLWVAPMREVEVYMTLRQLLNRSVIELNEPAGEEVESEGPSTVQWA